VLSVAGHGPVDDWWRVVAVSGWDHLDSSGGVVDVSRLRVPGSVERGQPRPGDRRVREDGDGQ
jgi:glycerol-1-phosphatase